MSHNKERAEKICLNCGAELHGRYCHVCGQENVEPKESLWHLVTHYAYDITHFDGKFFKTLQYLALRPGILPAEYLKGKRVSYLHPIRMYVFTSALFFIIVFSMFHLEDTSLGREAWKNADTTRRSGAKLRENAYKNAKTKRDSAVIAKGLSALEGGRLIVRDKDSGSTKSDVNFGVFKSDFKTVAAYDSAQNALPENDRAGWFERRMERRNIEIWQKYNGDVNAIVTAWLTKFTHTIPQLLFLSLPLFSFVLWLLYIRRRDQFFYTGHVIFSLYLYIFYFIAYLLFFGLQELHKLSGWGIWGWVEAALWIYMLYYMYKSMRNFYKQRRFKTFVKLVLLSFASFFVILFLFVLFSIFSAFTV